MRVLVVDDDPSLMGLIEMILTGDGHQVTTAASGEDALRVAEGHPFDLVLLDWTLPGVDGATVCRALRAAVPELPVIMLTGHHAAEQRAAGLAAGAIDFVTKPFVVDDLLGRVRQAGSPAP